MDLVSELGQSNRKIPQTYDAESDESDQYDDRISSYCEQIIRHVNNFPVPKLYSRERDANNYRNRIYISSNDSSVTSQHKQRFTNCVPRKNSGNPLKAPKGTTNIGYPSIPSLNRRHNVNPTYAEKSTFCRPAVDIYSKEFIFKTVQRNAKLQGLVKKLVQAREKEKKLHWKNHLNDLKEKPKPYMVTENRNRNIPTKKSEFLRTLNTDYYNKFSYRSPNYYQNLYPTYIDTANNMLETEYPRNTPCTDVTPNTLDSDFPATFQEPSTALNQKNVSYTIFDQILPPCPRTPPGSLLNCAELDVRQPSWSKRSLKQRRPIRFIDIKSFSFSKNVSTQTIIHKNKLATQTDTNNNKFSTQTDLWQNKDYIQAETRETKPSTQADFLINKLATQTEITKSNLSMKTALTLPNEYYEGPKSPYNLTPNESYKDKMNKVSSNIERLKQKIVVSEVELKYSQLTSIERKLDDLIHNINNLMAEVRLQKLTNSAFPHEHAHRTLSTTSYVVETCPSHRDIICGSMQDRAISNVAIDDHNCEDTLYKILKNQAEGTINTNIDISLDKSNRSSSNGHITFNIPTKDGNKIKDRRFKINSRTVYVQELASDHKLMTKAVNTDRLGLLGLLRVSAEAVRQILSFVPQIDYYWYLSKLPIAKPRNVYEYVCYICGAAFEKPSRLSDHVQRHNLGKTRDCCVCRHTLESYKRKEGLFTCRHCGQRFTRAYCKELHEVDCARMLAKNYPAVSGTSSLVILR